MVVTRKQMSTQNGIPDQHFPVQPPESKNSIKSEKLFTHGNNNGFSFQDPVTGLVWKKVLYEQNPFPDNFTPDECFLAAIEKNKNLYKYSFKQSLEGACQVRILCLCFI